MIVIFFLKKSARTQRDCNPPLDGENMQGRVYAELLPMQENEMSYEPLRVHQNLGIHESHLNLPTRSATQDRAVGMDTGPYDATKQDIHRYIADTMQKHTELIPVPDDGTNYN